MKETDIRARIHSYLETKLRKAVLPVGLGMAVLAGCSPEPTPLYSAPDTGVDASNEVVARYMGPMPDGGSTDAPVALYMAPMPVAK